MKKFGFKSRSKEDSDDSNRSALFGSRSSKSSSQAPASTNPYAQPQNAPDPYAQDTTKYAHMGGKPYSDGAGGYGGGEPKSGGYGGLNNDSKYGGDNKQPGGGYGASAGGYGGNGYGADRYGSSAGAASTRGPSGYGGLGRSNSQETATTDDNRSALFGGAKDRYAQKSNLPPSNDQSGTAGYGGQSGAAGGGANQGYGAYEDKQLTAEEEEEEDVQATKQQIRFMKQEDVSSTRNALRIAAQAEETGRDTLTRLGAQGERIHNTEKNLDLAGNTNRVAEERARELKTLNKSMFAVHVSNPFTAGSRKQARDDDVMNKHRTEREQREATRQAAFDSRARMESHAKNTAPGQPGYGKPAGKASLAERAKYQFEADSEDDEMENEIDGNLDALSGAAGRLNALARATGKEVEEQNVHIDRIATKSDKVDDQIAMNRARLDRFH